MNELALFAGAGGGILGGSLLGWKTICAVEFEPHHAAILCQRQDDGILPPFPIWDDVRTFDGQIWRGRVDVISGGFPCQAYSTAAAGKNNADDLWPEMRRIVADVSPRYVFAENVSKEAINIAADDLEQMGYKVKCTSLSASDLGADHIRKRYWLRAHANVHSKLFRPINAKMEILQKFRPRIWESYPNEPRMADGLAHRMDRLTATGNGQIPAVVAFAWEILSNG